MWSFPSVEAQVAAFADDIAYDAHDIDDGLRAELFSLDDIAAVALPGEIIADIRATFPGLDAGRVVHEFIRRLIGLLIEDVIAETGRRLAALAPRSADDVRRASSGIAGFSPAVAEAERAIKDFLERRMYRHARVQRVMNEAAGVVSDLFARYSTASRRSAGGMAGRARRRRRGDARPPYRRFHCRHDRPLCARRTCAAF